MRAQRAYKVLYITNILPVYNVYRPCPGHERKKVPLEGMLQLPALCTGIVITKEVHYLNLGNLIWIQNTSSSILSPAVIQKTGRSP